jgi:hypothetical protein
VRDRGVDDEPDAGHGHADLRPDEQLPPVERVGERTAEQGQCDERDELDEGQRRDSERRPCQLVDLERQSDLNDAAAEILGRLTEPEPAKRGRVAERRQVDREPREALANARALEPGRKVVGEAGIAAQKS